VTHEPLLMLERGSFTVWPDHGTSPRQANGNGSRALKAFVTPRLPERFLCSYAPDERMQNCGLGASRPMSKLRILFGILERKKIIFSLSTFLKKLFLIP